MTILEASIEYVNAVKCDRVYTDLGSVKWPGDLPAGVDVVAPMTANLANKKAYIAMLERKYGLITEQADQGIDEDSDEDAEDSDEESETANEGQEESARKNIMEMTNDELRAFVEKTTGEKIPVSWNRGKILAVLEG